MTLMVVPEAARTNPISFIEHIYNPNISYVSGPTPYQEHGKIAYTYASPPQKTQQNLLPLPYRPHVQLTIRFRDHVYTGYGTVVGPYHVLTSAYPIYDSKKAAWADEITFADSHGTCQIVKAYAFTESKEQKDPRYNIALLILSKSIGKQTGWNGLLSIPDDHLQQEKIQITGYSSEHTLKKIEPERLHYTPALPNPQLGSALWVSGWKSSMIIGLETQDKDQTSFALRLTQQKVEALSQKIAENFKKFPLIPFGKAQWAQHFGDVGVEPPFAPNIKKILYEPCPIWSGKKIYETHLLTLIPKTINGQLLTVKSLGELVQKPLQGPATKYRYFNLDKYNDQPTRASHWTLLSRDVIPGSRYESYSDQRKLVKKYPGYEIPNILDATVSIFMEHVRSERHLYPDKPWTFTRCQEKYNPDEQLAVGGFTVGGLDVNPSSMSTTSSLGVGVQRKFS
jgi:hypothetical protein